MSASRVRERAVVLLSGGLDSATMTAMAIAEGFAVHALSVDYGQRQRIELDAARAVARALGVVEHRVMAVSLRDLGGSALTDDIDVPRNRLPAASTGPIPVTYVPARNTILLSMALAWVEVLGGRDIFIGANAIDYSGYPDCRPEFIAAFETMANLATRIGVDGSGRPLTVHAPLVSLTKAEIIRRGVDLGVDFALTHSCYDPTPTGRPCGTCDACLLRAAGFREAGVADAGA